MGSRRILELDYIWRLAEMYPHIDLGSERHLTESLFASIYKYDLWHDREVSVEYGGSSSGPGSSLRNTSVLRLMLPDLIEHLGVKTILDAGCGDFNWMKELDLRGVKVLACDIVPEVVASNNKRYASTNIEFFCMDIIRDVIPNVDLILCKDVFIHFSLPSVLKSIRGMKNSGSTYLLTNHDKTLQSNVDTATSNIGRSINFRLPPFDFRAPLVVLEDLLQPWACLGLWALAGLEI